MSATQPIARSLDRPDEALEIAGVHKDVVRLDGVAVTRAVYPPGWRHADHDPAPCPHEHVGYCAAGSIRVWWPDGSAVEVAAGEAFRLPPGHDAATDGGCTLIQFDGGPAAAGR